MKKISISGTGCALLDYFYPEVSFHGTEFKKYQSLKDGDGGISPGKLVFTHDLERFSGKRYHDILSDLTDSATYSRVNIGGPSVVSLIHLSQLMQNSSEIRFFGVMGTDEIAKDFYGLMGKLPLDVSHIEKIEGSSPFTHVLSDRGFQEGMGERSFINNLGVAAEFHQLPDMFFDADICVFGGTALLPEIHDRLDKYLKMASDRHCFTVVNTVYDFRYQQRFPEKPWPLGKDHSALPFIDLLIMDLEESLKISGKEDPYQALDYFVEKGTKGVIITRGAKPVLSRSTSGRYSNDELLEIPVSSKVSQLLNSINYEGDTTGCGDNFTGGVLYALADQIRTGNSVISMKPLLDWGIASGSFALLYQGGTWYEQYPGEKLERIAMFFPTE